MMTGRYVMRYAVLTAATARLDRGFTGQNRNDWLRRVAGKMHVALNRWIPVGFEDEAEFHPGVQPARKDDRMDWERAGIFSTNQHF